MTALLGLGALALSTGCANRAGPARTSPIQASQPAASAPAPVASNAQAMWAVLTGLPSHDVNLIVPGLTLQMRQDLTAIAGAAIDNHSAAVSGLPVAPATLPPSVDSKAIWGVLAGLPNHDVAVIAPGLDHSVRDDLHGIILAVAGSIDH